MFSSLSVKVPAKVNLFLNLIRPRPDGFHEVRFVMQTIALFDELLVQVQGPGYGLELSCSQAALAQPDNLVAQAYHQFYKETGFDPYRLSVHLEKQIPTQAGMGGGSADAAAMLQILNHLHGNTVAVREMASFASFLGSDVPFFLVGGTCLAMGRGEIITPLPDLPEIPIVVLKPKHYGISTPEAFQRVRQARRYRERSDQDWQPLLEQPAVSPQALGMHLWNDFEATTYDAYPDLAAAIQILKQEIGLPGALLSGSGPALFGILSEPDNQREAIAHRFDRENWELFFTHFLSRSNCPSIVPA